MKTPVIQPHKHLLLYHSLLNLQHGDNQEVDEEIKRKLERIEVEELNLQEAWKEQAEKLEEARRALERKMAEKRRFEELQAKRRAKRRLNLEEYRNKRNGEIINEVVLD